VFTLDEEARVDLRGLSLALTWGWSLPSLQI
jgi:hypothetical protein